MDVPLICLVFQTKLHLEDKNFYNQVHFIYIYIYKKKLYLSYEEKIILDMFNHWIILVINH